jgi:hypothetical protein
MRVATRRPTGAASACSGGSDAQASKRPRDPSELDKLIVDLATGAAREEKQIYLVPVRTLRAQAAQRGGRARGGAFSGAASGSEGSGKAVRSTPGKAPVYLGDSDGCPEQ